MSDIKILREMLTDAMQVPLIESLDGKRQVKLIENDQTYYEVVIKGIPNDVIVIKTDAFPALKDVFKNSKRERKRSDFAIVVETEKQKWIVFIEMKASKNASTKDEVIRQLNGARCVICYCQAIGQLFWETPDFLENYEPRFVRIIAKSAPIRKQNTRPKEEINDTPERMLTLKKPDLKFNELIGKTIQ